MLLPWTAEKTGVISSLSKDYQLTPKLVRILHIYKSLFYAALWAHRNYLPILSSPKAGAYKSAPLNIKRFTSW